MESDRPVLSSQGLYEADRWGETPERGLPHLLATVSAGFPSPAEDYIDTRLDLNHLLIRHPSTTFLVTVAGESMKDANIRSGDILVVDRSLEPSSGRIVIAALEGELVVKRLAVDGEGLSLVPENPAYKRIRIAEGADLKIWGVVTAVIHRL